MDEGIMMEWHRRRKVVDVLFLSVGLVLTLGGAIALFGVALNLQELPLERWVIVSWAVVAIAFGLLFRYCVWSRR